MLLAALPPPLKPYIRSLWQMDVGPGEEILPGWIAPDGQVEIVFHAGAPTSQRSFGASEWIRQPQAFVLPLRRGALQLAAYGRNCIVALRVDPVVASVLLRRPMGELWDISTPLSDVVGPQAHALLDALAVATPMGRFEIIEQWVSRSLADWTCSHDQLKAIHTRLFWRSDGAALSKVTKDLGVTMRSLRRWTADTAGLSPKEIERMGRILRACASLQDQPSKAIGEVALELGFYDQPAFTQAFSRQVGMSPSAFRALPLVFCEREHG